MNIILHCVDRIREKVCKRFNICHVYLAKVGVKNYNIGMFIPHAKPLSQTIVSIPSSALFLGIDYLDDKYSLLGINIAESPHYHFLKAIKNGDNITETDYYRRAENGTLDVRRGRVQKKRLEHYMLRYTERLKEFQNGTLAPVLVYQLCEKYYIYDGKHRAALCALMGSDVKCQLVSCDRFDIRYKLICDNKNYLKHHMLFNMVLTHDNNN